MAATRRFVLLTKWAQTGPKTIIFFRARFRQAMATELEPQPWLEGCGAAAEALAEADVLLLCTGAGFSADSPHLGLLKPPCFLDFLDFMGSVLAHYVKLTASLVVTSEFLRVILVYELSREVCRPSGGHFRRRRFFEKSSKAIPSCCSDVTVGW